MHCQNKHRKNILLEFNRLTVYVSASEWHLFPKGDNNYNKKEFSLDSMEVLDSIITLNHESIVCKQMYPIPKHVCIAF